MASIKTRKTVAGDARSRPAAAASPGGDVLVLAPMVVAMRLPVVWWEMATPFFSAHRREQEGHRAVFEKAAAIAESYGATQAEIAQATVRLWIGVMAGEVPDATLVSRSFNDIVDASVEPHARRVRANYRRLRAANRTKGRAR